MLCVKIKLKVGGGEEMGVLEMGFSVNRRNEENVSEKGGGVEETLRDSQVEGRIGQRPRLGFAPGLLR